MGVCKSESFKQLFPKKLVTVLEDFSNRRRVSVAKSQVFAATPERQRGSDVGEVTVSSLTRSLLPVWHDYVLFYLHW